MNIAGGDLKIIGSKSDPVKSLNGRKRFVWVYSAVAVRATFNPTPTKTSNDGENTHSGAAVKVGKGGQTQLIKAKGFCGGQIETEK